MDFWKRKPNISSCSYPFDFKFSGELHYYQLQKLLNSQKFFCGWVKTLKMGHSLDLYNMNHHDKFQAEISHRRSRIWFMLRGTFSLIFADSAFLKKEKFKCLFIFYHISSIDHSFYPLHLVLGFWWNPNKGGMENWNFLRGCCQLRGAGFPSNMGKSWNFLLDEKRFRLRR